MKSELLELLVCPITKGPLSYDKENNELISKAAKLAFPCLLYTSPSPRDQRGSRMPSSA